MSELNRVINGFSTSCTRVRAAAGFASETLALKEIGYARTSHGSSDDAPSGAAHAYSGTPAEKHKNSPESDASVLLVVPRGEKLLRASGAVQRSLRPEQNVTRLCSYSWHVGYAGGMSIAHVLPSREARTEIPKALRRFRTEGATADPVVFGSHRRPEAVVIPFELYTSLLPAIEEIEIAQIVRERQVEQARPLSEFAAELGLDVADYE